MAVLSVSGKGAKEAFQHEPGGHRWQGESKGKTHTSTITVAVLEVPEHSSIKINPRDLDIRTCRGSGAGGQHRNTTDSAVQITHIPTGVSVRCEGERSQHKNKALGLKVLSSRIANLREEKTHKDRSRKRKGQVGTGMRADKVRTIALQRGQVIHHPTGGRMTTKKYLQGHLEALWVR